VRVDSAASLDEALRTAFAASGPMLVEVLIEQLCAPPRPTVRARFHRNAWLSKVDSVPMSGRMLAAARAPEYLNLT